MKVPELAPDRSAATGADLTGPFFQAAARSPQAPAVYDGTVYSYGELAGWVRAAGGLFDTAGDGVVAAVEIGRSVHCLVAFVAALHAGAVPVLVDPHLPGPRRRQILDDCRPGLTVDADDVERALRRAAPEEPAGARLPQPAPHPQSLAYVCYTSGSTGRPRGVAVPRSALAARLDWGQSCYPLGAQDRVAWLTSPGFDFAIWEMLAPLRHGASVVVGHDQALRDMAGTAAQIVGAGVTAAHFVPSVLRAYLRTVDIDTLGGLRYLFLGGETCDAALLRRLRPLRGTRVFNQYGPTETCIDSTWFECTGLDLPDGDAVPIGRPVDGTRTMVLDDLGVPGAPQGELGVAGAGLAWGYLNDPRATGERFVPDPTAPHGDRVYRTGDLVRVNADGLLEFLGRRDEQVKINGVRIELAEVRARLGELCPGAEVAVDTWSGPGEEVRLVAFVAGADGATEGGQLVRELHASLPAAMVPMVVTVPELTRLPSGKVDTSTMTAAYLAAEPDMAAGHPGAGNDAGPAGGRATATESRLAGIWAQVLGVPTVTTGDNFFELGGHSLMAIEVAALIEEAFDVELPLREVFDCDTLGHLAKLVDTLCLHGPADQKGGEK
ncbi:non-ribosomal peptide synthetase [Plantactinospora sp. WMMB334]|uniref:non-ribosomal peptide synthetase n=1 Tax=Plantactinospora sp. WMMB334 TaxID=3404119 RepID=UPI003B95EDE4